MKRLTTLLLMLALATPLFAADVFVPLSTTEGLLIQAPGAAKITTTRIPIQSIGTVVIDDGPVTPDPVVPVGTLAEIVEKATAAVVDTDKDENARSIAFNVNFIKPYLKGNANVADITKILKTMSDDALGDSATAWAGW